MNKIQDWEFAEETSPDEYETVNIHITTKKQAIKQAQNYANIHKHRCVVLTSMRFEEKGHVIDRDFVKGNPIPIIIMPHK